MLYSKFIRFVSSCFTNGPINLIIILKINKIEKIPGEKMNHFFYLPLFVKSCQTWRDWCIFFLYFSIEPSTNEAYITTLNISHIMKTFLLEADGHIKRSAQFNNVCHLCSNHIFCNNIWSHNFFNPWSNHFHSPCTSTTKHKIVNIMFLFPGQIF